MSVTYYVAVPFLETEDGIAAGRAQELLNATAAIRRAEALAHVPGFVGAIAFKRTGDPNLGTFDDAEVLMTFGTVPDDLASL